MQNNFEQKAENTQDFQLRWLIITRVFKGKTRWNSSPSDVNKYPSEPILQYSTNGKTWNTVPTVYEQVEV